jgi:hypothetical protein
MLCIVAVYARLLALVLLVACVSAITQTGTWRGPADIACVGEGHSMRPDRRSDELITSVAETRDLVALPPEQPGAVCGASVTVASQAVRVPISGALRQHRRPGAPRGPPVG